MSVKPYFIRFGCIISVNTSGVCISTPRSRVPRPGIFFIFGPPVGSTSSCLLFGDPGDAAPVLSQLLGMGDSASLVITGRGNVIGRVDVILDARYFNVCAVNGFLAR